MLDITPFTDEQWWNMCDAGMGLPLPLDQADLSKPFVYDRSYGVFYVPMGQHQHAMSLLLAFQHGLASTMGLAEKLGLEPHGETADRWLESTPGAAFRSTVGKRIQVATGKGLTAQERRLFGDFERVFA